MTNNQIKQIIKKAEQYITQTFTYIPDHPQESKGSQFRKTYYKYPIVTEGEFGIVSPHILLEINSFTTPEPRTKVNIQSLITSFLEAGNYSSLINQFELMPFPLYVLNVERTIIEKIMSLVRACCSPDPIANLRYKIRHIYDLCMIMRHRDYKQFIEENNSDHIFNMVVAADKIQFGEQSALWLNASIEDIVLFCILQL